MKKPFSLLLLATMSSIVGCSSITNSISSLSNLQTSSALSELPLQETNQQPLQMAKLNPVKHSFRNTISNVSYQYYDSGISPKVYGMNYVKRGTHKRTNI